MPRQLAGLPGILLWPLLHGGFFHLISNTVPLLIFGFFGYLLARGWYERSLKSAAIALLVAVVYGGLIFGVLPRDGQVSWEGHLFGLFAGVLAARFKLTLKKTPS